MAVKFTETIKLVTVDCCDCGVMFAVPDSLDRRNRERGDWFYCPNGHKQHYTESAVERLQSDLKKRNEELGRMRSQVTHVRDQRDAAERSARAFKGQATKLRKRVSAGVCPCCHRTFKQLADHMKAKHPEYGEEVDTHGENR